jgi:rhamnogalacturonan endolyase
MKNLTLRVAAQRHLHRWRLFTRAVSILTLCTTLLLSRDALGAFGYTDNGTAFVVDTGAGLIFQVRKSDGTITSIRFNGTEYNGPSGKGSHIASGLGSTGTSVSATNHGNVVKVTLQTSGANSVVANLTHYLIVTNGVNTIYMATYPVEEPGVGELRWITRLDAGKIGNGPIPSDNRGNTGAIESSDVFGMADGTTRSKYYGDNVTNGKARAMDLTYCGATGPNIGCWMVFGNRESSSGGPFYRDIENQCGGDQEIYNYMNSGHYQTEAYRLNVLHGPYALVFTTGATPSLPINFSWLGALGLTGWVGDSGRGTVTGTASGIPSGFQGVVGFANSTAQYWAVVDANGSYTSPKMKPGTYTVTLYKGELAVATSSVSVTAGSTTTLHLTSGESTGAALFRIGEWDGSPAGLLNSDKVIEMHPSDVRMSDWGPVTFVVGTDSNNKFPAYQWKDGVVNNPSVIKFNLTSSQIRDRVLKIGITAAYAGGRPKPLVNSWTPSNPAISSQPSGRCFTVGTYRGNNTLYSWTVPASAFVVGENTLRIDIISGSSGTGYLSPASAYDCIELEGDQATGTPPAAPSSLTATAVSSSRIDLSWTDDSSDEDGFKIERSTDGTSFTQIATVGANVTTYSDTGLSASTTYYYRVRAHNSAGDSSYSNTANATTQAASAPAAPTNLTAQSPRKRQIALNWTQSTSPNITENQVYRSTTSGGPYSLVATLSATTSYTDTGLSSGTTYHYVVTARNSDGLESSYSNQASATAK